MKKKQFIILFVILYILYKAYSWLKKERKKYKNDIKTVNNRCVNYPINTAPGSFYNGVYDTESLTIVKISFIIIVIGIVYVII